MILPYSVLRGWSALLRDSSFILKHKSKDITPKQKYAWLLVWDGKLCIYSRNFTLFHWKNEKIPIQISDCQYNYWNVASQKLEHQRLLKGIIEIIYILKIFSKQWIKWNCNQYFFIYHINKWNFDYICFQPLQNRNKIIFVVWMKWFFLKINRIEKLVFSLSDSCFVSDFCIGLSRSI